MSKNKNLDEKIGKHSKSDGKKIKKNKPNKSKKQIDNFNLDNNKPKKEKKALKIVLSIILIIVIILGVIFGRYLYKSGGSITGAVMNMMKDVVGDKDPIFVLVMGVSEDISAELTDTIMLMGYNPETNQAFVLSIPRDTFIGNNEATAGGFDKINALYQKSPGKTVEAVENLTGVNIDYYITVKTSALVQIVDAIGGVEFDVPINMDYDDSTQDLHIHLKAGTQTLNGDQAEQVVRFRHNNNGTTYSAEYGDNDEGRMRTQREFLKAVATQVVSWDNIDKVKEIATAVFSNLETDMTLSKMLGYAPYATDFNVDGLSMDQLPGTPEMINDLWFYRADSEETSDLINSYIEKLGLDDKEKAKYIKTDVKTTTKKTVKKNETSTNTTTKNTTKNTNETNTIKNTTVKENTVKENNLKNETTKNNTTKNTTNTNSENEITNRNTTNTNTVKNEVNTNTTNKNETTKVENKVEEPATEEEVAE